ncbi:DNA starvation/stationary phase protection protein Dps [soil metagenome]
MAKKTSVKTSIDLPQATRQTMVDLLNQQLADTFDLFSQVKQAHWNVKGDQFIALHKLYDDLAEELLEQGDMIAERATALGGAAHGTARMAAASSRLTEFPDGPIGSVESVKELVKRYAHYAETTRSSIDSADDAGDMSTSDLFTEISRSVDKNLWFLEAHVQ